MRVTRKPLYQVELGKRLRAAREALGRTQAQLAADLGVAETTYAGWERADLPPRLENLVALANLLHQSIDYLLGRVSDSSPSIEERGVRWRLDWAEVTPAREAAATIWRRLIRGERVVDIAADLNSSSAGLERPVHDLVLSDHLVIEAVERSPALERALRERFNTPGDRALLRDVWVANVAHIDWQMLMVRYALLGFLAKEHFVHTVQSGNSVGLCGGYAVSRMVHALRRGECPAGIRVRPLAVTPVFEAAAVSANSVVSALAYRHAGYSVQANELTFIFDHGNGDDAAPPAQIARRILSDARAVDFVYMGIGSRATGALQRNISDFRRDYQWLARVNLSEIQAQEKPIGDILYHLIGPDGEPLADFKQHNEQLVCSIGLRGLRDLVDAGKQVVVIAAGEEKADVTRAAIRRHYANTLIVDDELARAILRE